MVLTAEKAVDARSASPGDLLAFGSYPQGSSDSPATPILWRVLQNTGSELFMLSEYILDCRRYHPIFMDTTWLGSDIRMWLNGEFYDAAFGSSEKAIIKVTCCTDNGPGEGNPDTFDKVFLLSAGEARDLTCKGDALLNRAMRGAVGTEFSRFKKDDGCLLYVYDKKVSEDYILLDGKATGCSWWWLRTKPENRSRAYFVGARGSIKSYGNVDIRYYGVRPALKVKVS